jgi:hypothetical protein
MKFAHAGAALLAASALASCGGGESTPGQPSAEERRQLDNAAAKLDENAETYDTSPDSLVPAEGSAAAANEAAPANSVENVTTANTAAPR